MKKTLLRMLSLVLAVCLMLPAIPAYAASGTTGEGISWNVTDGTLTFSGKSYIGDYYRDNAPWNGYHVERIVIGDGIVGIGSYAFYDMEDVTEVVIPSSVEFISRYSFGDCTELEFVYLPDGVESLATDSFSGCTSLRAIHIPATVSSPNTFYPFDDCDSLETIYGAGFDAEWLADSYGVEFVHAVPTGMSIKSLPSKTEYLVGSSFDSAGFAMELVYNDGALKVDISSGYKLTGFYPKAVGRQTVTAACYGFSCSFDVTVYSEEAFTQSIALAALPAKLTYTQGDLAVDPSGGQVTVTYRDGSTRTAALAGYMVRDFDTSVPGEKTLTVELNGKTCTFDIEILKKQEKTFQVQILDTPVYTGQAQTPAVEVFEGGTKLTQDVDYTLSYGNNVNASGEAEVLVTGIGAYAGVSQTTAFTILPKSIENVTGELNRVKYTGKRVVPTGKLYVDDVLLVEDQDYFLHCVNNAKEGTATAYVVGKGNYTGCVPMEYEVKFSADGPVKSYDAMKAGDFDLTMAGGSLSFKVPEDVLYGYTFWKGNTPLANYSSSRPTSSASSFSISLADQTSGNYTILYAVYNYTVEVRMVNGTYQYVYKTNGTLASGRVEIKLTADKAEVVNANKLQALPGESVDVRTMILPLGSLPADANVFPATFTSSDETVATVDNHGVVKLLKSGNVSITATYNGKTAQWDLEMAPLALEGNAQILNYDQETSKATVGYKGEVLIPDTDYTLSVTEKDGKTTVTANGTGLFGGSISATYGGEGGAAVGCDHTYSQWITRDDVYHTSNCTSCGNRGTLPHNWNQGETTTPASCKQDGQKTYTCVDCGATSVQTIGRNDQHTGQWTVTRPATTTQTGLESCTCTVCGASVTRETEKLPVVFTDVQPGAFYYDAVQWAVKNGITSGKTATTFAPTEPCTRAQVVTFLWRAAGEPEPASMNNPFPDVANGKYFTKAVLWAAEQGITGGYKDGTFRPNNTCTRDQIVTFLWRYMGQPEPASMENTFPDVEDGKFYTRAVLWAAEQGITGGYTDGTFRPTSLCRRDQIVTFLYRAIGKQ